MASGSDAASGAKSIVAGIRSSLRLDGEQSRDGKGWTLRGSGGAKAVGAILTLVFLAGFVIVIVATLTYKEPGRFIAMLIGGVFSGGLASFCGYLWLKSLKAGLRVSNWGIETLDGRIAFPWGKLESIEKKLNQVTVLKGPGGIVLEIDGFLHGLGRLRWFLERKATQRGQFVIRTGA